MPSWLVGLIDAGYAWEFIQDLKTRLANRIQLTTDGHKVYLEAIEDAFGADVDYAMLVKQKIQYFLTKEDGVPLSTPKICEILAEKYVLRSKWKKNQPRGPIPQAIMLRQVIQKDTIDFGEVFAFTAIDTFSQEADILLAPA